MKKNIVAAVVLVMLGAGGAAMYLRISRSSGEGRTVFPAEFCAKHQIAEKDCPWCDISLVEKRGMCAGHGVPEALCSKCNPALIPGFKAERDWCAGHGVPESQCAPCNQGCSSQGKENIEHPSAGGRQ